ncbi:hypothetical protein V6N12_023682 [Hibiscus sabdariffa]|uniref:RNase H type-1 domain-containing protein n=1 Tax=Hibiscus sabdariffa TaxID=183260 RepID=A0ABR2FYE1_9ROSI
MQRIEFGVGVGEGMCVVVNTRWGFGGRYPYAERLYRSQKSLGEGVTSESANGDEGMAKAICDLMIAVMEEPLLLCFGFDIYAPRGTAESDCMDAVHIVLGVSEIDIGHAMVDRLKDLTDQEWNLQVRHIHRECNVCANRMAGLGRMQRLELIEYANAPEEIVDLIQAEASSSR